MNARDPQRRGTATSSFGVSRRESHDASAFYERFDVPEISTEQEVAEPSCRDKIWVGDARHMDDYGDVADNSVALVVTSPPYFAGKEYEEAVGHGHVPGDYVAYLKMLEDVFGECVRKLEPGGRIAVNVANLGRRPYRSLSADVITILQDRLRLLLRGEVIWHKARGAAGNCAWGSFQQPSNPVLRDLTERVIIASKGRFDRALAATVRSKKGLPSVSTARADEFMEATTDVWEIAPASATSVGHPAPFPVELPQRLIELYTYRGDLVLDPFMGAGTTAIAALWAKRNYVGFETDASYVDLAREWIEATKQSLNNGEDRDVVEVPRASGRNGQLSFIKQIRAAGTPQFTNAGGAGSSSEKQDFLCADDEDFQSRASKEGRRAQEMAYALLHDCGFSGIVQNVKYSCGVEVNFKANDQQGTTWLFDVSGAFSVTKRPGLRRTDTLWKALGKAAVLHQTNPGVRLVLLTTDRPTPNSAGANALETMVGVDKPIRLVVEMNLPEDKRRLQRLARGEIVDAE